MDFVSENERRELGEENETQRSSTSRQGQRRYQHPWLPWVRATAFQRHRSGFQGKSWRTPAKADAECLACASFLCIHGAERSRGKESPMGSKLERGAGFLPSVFLLLKRAVGTEDAFGRNLWSQTQKWSIAVVSQEGCNGKRLWNFLMSLVSWFIPGKTFFMGQTNLMKDRGPVELS